MYVDVHIIWVAVLAAFVLVVGAMMLCALALCGIVVCLRRKKLSGELYISVHVYTVQFFLASSNI